MLQLTILNCVDEIIFGVSIDVVGGLVDHVHQDGGEVGGQKDAGELSAEDDSDEDKLSVGQLVPSNLCPPVLYDVLTKPQWALVNKDRPQLTQIIGHTLKQSGALQGSDIQMMMLTALLCH